MSEKQNDLTPVNSKITSFIIHRSSIVQCLTLKNCIRYFIKRIPKYEAGIQEQKLWVQSSLPDKLTNQGKGE